MTDELNSNVAYMKVSFSWGELRDLKSAVLEGRPYAERISFAFAIRLVEAYSNRLGYSQILDEVDYLEGLRPTSITRPATPFKRAPLKPLWHKHFYAPRHFMKNIGIRWGLGRNGNRDLDRLLEEIAKSRSDDWIAQLTHQIVMGGYRERVARGLTGDWIIFGKHEGLNYYLDIATHAEAEGNDGQAALMEKIRRGSEAEFPFVFSS